MNRRPSLGDAPPVPPGKLAHIVLRTAKLREAKAWYETVLNARVMFDAGVGAGLTYDNEHHRLALVEMTAAEMEAVAKIGDLMQRVDAARRMPGLEHVAFTFNNLGDLLANYLRLKKSEILPVLCINHGPTISMYYMDPDGNNVELQVDTMPMDQAVDFLMSPGFRANQVGYPFDPDELCERYEAGEPIKDLVQEGWRELSEA